MMALKGRRFIDITTVEVKLRDAHAKFQTMPFTKCFKWSCIKFTGDDFEGDSID
jgi:hypothetical protein